MSATPILLRRATREDDEAVARLLRRMLEETSSWGRDPLSPDPRAWEELALTFRDELAREETFALIAGAELGLIVARVDRLHLVFAPKRLLHVSALWVDPGARRRGLARRLLDEALAWGRSQGCEEARLNVLLGNPAHALYRAMGFEDVQVEMRRRIE